MSTTRGFGQLASNFADNYGAGPFRLPQDPLNVTQVISLWLGVLGVLTEIVVPHEKLSILHPSLISNQLASLRLSYYGENILPECVNDKKIGI